MVETFLHTEYRPYSNESSGETPSIVFGGSSTKNHELNPRHLSSIGYTYITQDIPNGVKHIEKILTIKITFPMKFTNGIVTPVTLC